MMLMLTFRLKPRELIATLWEEDYREEVQAEAAEYISCFFDPFLCFFLLVLRDLLLCFTVTYCKSMYIFVNLGAL